jgi:hypothetical protein
VLEKDIENLIAKYPEEIFPGESFNLIGQQVDIQGRRIDILFKDMHDRNIIIEVKRGILSREASGQIAEYYGLLKNENNNQIFELILCANIIPRERKTFLENIGIECKELGVVQITELAKKHEYQFIDDQSSFSTSSVHDISRFSEFLFKENQKDNTNELNDVWIFQANPNKYDILNSLNDPEIGNTIHWLVKQNINKIHKGHIVLIWMSGKDAGIYAITRVESEPSMMSESIAERKYWLDESDHLIENRVRLSILKKLLNNPLLKEKLKNIPGLSRLSILTQPQGTNFPVSVSEWEILYQLI